MGMTMTTHVAIHVTLHVAMHVDHVTMHVTMQMNHTCGAWSGWDLERWEGREGLRDLEEAEVRHGDAVPDDDVEQQREHAAQLHHIAPVVHVQPAPSSQPSKAPPIRCERRLFTLQMASAART